MSSSVCALSSFDVTRRRWERRIAVACLLLAGIVAPFCLRSAPIAAVVCIASIVILTFGFRRSGWLDGPARIERVEVSTDGNWQFINRTGLVIKTHLTPATHTYRRWLWLSFASGEVLLFGPGDLDPETGRRLRVLLRRSEEPEVPGRVA